MTIRKPTRLGGFSDSCPFGLGGFTNKGRIEYRTMANKVHRRGKRQFSLLGLVFLPIFIGLVLLFTYSTLSEYLSVPPESSLSDFQVVMHGKSNATGNKAATGTSTNAVASEQENSQQQSTTQTKGHHCLNKDFQPQLKVSVWTMLNDNMAYVHGAVKMGKSVLAHTKTPFDLVVMELESKPLSEESWKELTAAGFRKCSVSSIAPPDAAKTRHDLREKFAVLHVWAMEVYDRVIFLDADTFVQNNGVEDLIHMDLQGKPLGVTKDIRSKLWVETFNSGVMVLHPSQAEHDRLLKLLRSGMEFEYVMSDQGFFNEVYKDNWHEIGFVNNANLALYRFQKDFWNQHKLEDINVIHYTMQKPWKCQSKGPYGPICDIWINAK